MMKMYVIIAMLCTLFCGGGHAGEMTEAFNTAAVWGAQKQDGDTYDDTFDELDRLLEDRTDMSFSEMYGLVRSGDVDGAIGLALEAAADSLVYELRTSRELALQIIAVIILGSLFARMSGGMSGYVTENGFFVTYMILVSLLLGDFVIAQDVTVETIDGIIDFMRAFYPMYVSSILYVNGAQTAGYSQSVIILVIYLCQNVIITLLLPLIKCSGIMSLVNNLNREDYFSKMSELMSGVVSWALKAMFAVITGINVVKCMIAPSMDRITRNGILQSLGRVSGMASVSAACSVIISTGEFIRSCMGVTCTAILIVMSVGPMIKILVIVFTLRCIAAIVQPLGETRYANGVSAVASAVRLMLKACGISVMMFVLSIALMTMGVGGT